MAQTPANCENDIFPFPFPVNEIDKAISRLSKRLRISLTTCSFDRPPICEKYFVLNQRKKDL